MPCQRKIRRMPGRSRGSEGSRCGFGSTRASRKRAQRVYGGACGFASVHVRPELPRVPRTTQPRACGVKGKIEIGNKNIDEPGPGGVRLRVGSQLVPLVAASLTRVCRENVAFRTCIRRVDPSGLSRSDSSTPALQGSSLNRRNSFMGANIITPPGQAVRRHSVIFGSPRETTTHHGLQVARGQGQAWQRQDG